MTPKETPLLLSDVMVPPTLDGSKTQTRRLRGLEVVNMNPDARVGAMDNHDRTWDFKMHDGGHQRGVRCPYGMAGDRLWVRETWQHSNFPNGPLDEDCSIFFRADYLNDPLGPDLERDTSSNIRRKWKPSIHLPRWASRILLEVVNVRPERLQKISDADARAEGIEIDRHGWSSYGMDSIPQGTSIDSFCCLWSSINGIDSWIANPWVWRIEFKRLKP